MELYEDNQKENNPMKDRFVRLNLLKDDFPATLKEFAGKKINGFESFDVVYLGSVLHLLVEESVEKCLSNILQVLKTHGELFGQTVARETPKEVNREGGFRYLHSPTSLKQLMERLGYENVKIAWKDLAALTGNREYGMIQFYATKK